jgi:type II secretory pathway component GspD/PulD (secretin)
MIRGFLACGLVLWNVAAWSAEGPQMVAFTVTIATGSDAKLTGQQEPAELAQAVAALEQQGALTHISRMRFSTLEEQDVQFQFGETTSVITGRTFGFGSRGGQTGQPGAGGPQSVASYQQEQTGTMVRATTRVVDAGVVAEFSLEQSRFDKSRPAGEDPPVTPPEKAMTHVKTTVLIPRNETVLLGGFERTGNGVIQRTVVLVTANVSGPPVAAAAVRNGKPRELRIFALKHADCDAMQTLLTELLAQRELTVAIDARTNAVLVQADPETMSVVEAVLLRMDEPAKAEQ